MLLTFYFFAFLVYTTRGRHVAVLYDGLQRGDNGLGQVLYGHGDMIGVVEMYTARQRARNSGLSVISRVDGIIHIMRDLGGCHLCLIE